MRTLVCLIAICALFVPTLSADDRTDAWVAHLTQFTAAHPELTVEQKAVIQEARTLLEAGLLPNLRSADATLVSITRSMYDSFKTRAVSVFPKELYAEAFVRPAKTIRIGIPGGAVSRIPDCDCNSETSCDCVGGGCRVTQDGCGPLGGSICTGLCW